MSTIQEVLTDKMGKTLGVLKSELNTVRAGRANASLLDKVTVEYYGAETPLKNLANIGVPDPRTLMITPFDPRVVPDIEKAINMANLGINPSNDGKVIRLVIPPLTEERRKELAKQIKKIGEDAKIAIRNSRRDANDHIKKEEKAGELTEDESKKLQDQIQKQIDKCIKDIDNIVAEKDKELMEV